MHATILDRLACLGERNIFIEGEDDCAEMPNESVCPRRM